MDKKMENEKELGLYRDFAGIILVKGLPENSITYSLAAIIRNY